MTQNQKELVKDIIDSLAKTTQDAANALKIAPGSDIGKAVRLEFAMFLMYLSASDGEISWDETSFIAYLTNLSLTPQKVNDFIIENNIYSTEFEEKTPVVLKIAVELHNKMLEAGRTSEVNFAASIIDAFETVGKIFLSIDGEESTNEKADLEIYINALKRYAHESTIKQHNVATGYSKERNSINTPTKTGVSAPLKKG